jgi:hypothetical protein
LRLEKNLRTYYFLFFKVLFLMLKNATSDIIKNNKLFLDISALVKNMRIASVKNELKLINERKDIGE